MSAGLSSNRDHCHHGNQAWSNGRARQHSADGLRRLSSSIRDRARQSAFDGDALEQQQQQQHLRQSKAKCA
eukprot:1148558-Pelagomonas_calceolata.AAC.1